MKTDGLDHSVETIKFGVLDSVEDTMKATSNMSKRNGARSLFRRHLSSEFVQALKSNPFWARVCSDRQLQPEIRNNVVTIYYCGQALVRELRIRNGRLSASVHHKFVPLQKTSPSVYLPLTWNGATGFVFEEKLQPQLLSNGSSEVLKNCKRLMKFEAGPEDVLQQNIITNARNLILDQQIEFPGMGSNKIDLCHFDPSIARVVFVEIKRKEDLRLFGPGEEPEVIGQLRSYAEIIRGQEEFIMNGLAAVIRLKRELGLDSRLTGVPDDGLCLELKPLLVIGNCTDQDVQQIRRARQQGNGSWSSLWKHLDKVACGLIACGPKGCCLSLHGGGGQRWWRED